MLLTQIQRFRIQKQKRGFRVHLLAQKYTLGYRCQALFLVQHVVRALFHLSCPGSQALAQAFLHEGLATVCVGHLARATGLYAQKYGAGRGPGSSALVKMGGLTDRAPKGRSALQRQDASQQILEPHPCDRLEVLSRKRTKRKRKKFVA